MKAEVHYVAGYLKQAGEVHSGAAAADTEPEWGGRQRKKALTITLG